MIKLLDHIIDGIGGDNIDKIVLPDSIWVSVNASAVSDPMVNEYVATQLMTYNGIDIIRFDKDVMFGNQNEIRIILNR